MTRQEAAEIVATHLNVFVANLRPARPFTAAEILERFPRYLGNAAVSAAEGQVVLVQHAVDVLTGARPE